MAFQKTRETLYLYAQSLKKAREVKGIEYCGNNIW